MAGTDPRFDAARFRTAIKNAMVMGFPNETEKQITWTWDVERTFVTADSGGFPLDWSAAQVDEESDIADLIVDCAVKFTPVGGASRVGGTELGIMDVANVEATLLDVDYDALLVHGGGRFPNKAMLDGNVYVVQFVAPPFGLFEVNVYSVALQAIDES